MTHSNNVLILSAGRRVELTELFKKTAKDLKINSKIIAGDLQDNAPALFYADEKVLLPRVTSPEYIDSIIHIANQYDVGLIIPTIDTELQILSINKNKIENNTSAKVMISSEEVIRICRDKINTSRFFHDNNLGAPIEFQRDDINDSFSSFPVFVKPKAGSSSIDTYKVNSLKEFNEIIDRIKDPIIQEYIDGEEYTVDVFTDFNSKIISIVPRLRIATRGGEIAKGKVTKDQIIINEVKKLINILKPIGHITVQLFKIENSVKYIEINPRFGGGAPMSIQCGANSCEYLFRLLNDEELKYTEDYQDNLMFLRFDRSICIDENGDIIVDKSSDF